MQVLAIEAAVSVVAFYLQSGRATVIRRHRSGMVPEWRWTLFLRFTNKFYRFLTSREMFFRN